MDIRQLELFLAVMEAGSVVQAAARCGLSPGAVSQQLHRLADSLEVVLFTRTSRRLLPTPAAQELAELARGLIAHTDEVRRKFLASPDQDDRPFHLATGTTTLLYRLGHPLRLLRRRHPKIDLRVTVKPTEEMVNGLLERRFDLAIVSLPLNEPRLPIVPLYQEELLIIQPSPRSVRGWHVGALPAHDLKRQPFLLYPPSSNMRQLINQYLAGLGVKLDVRMEADDSEVITRLVESGFGWSILPEFALRRSPRYFRVFRLAGQPRLLRDQAIALPPAPYVRPLAREIAAFLQLQLKK